MVTTLSYDPSAYVSTNLSSYGDSPDRPRYVLHNTRYGRHATVCPAMPYRSAACAGRYLDIQLLQVLLLIALDDALLLQLVRNNLRPNACTAAGAGNPACRGGRSYVVQQG